MGVRLTFDGETVSGKVGTISVSGAEYELHLEFDPHRRRLRPVGEGLMMLTDEGKPAWWAIETEFDRNRGDGNVLVRGGPERPTFETGYRLEHMERTALSQVQDSHYGFVLEVRQALSSWRVFHLNPQAIRAPSASISSWDLEPDGAGLPTVLATLERETGPGPHDRWSHALRTGQPRGPSSFAGIAGTGDIHLMARLTALREASDRAQPSPLCFALGVAVRSIEAWLLADEQAIRAALEEYSYGDQAVLRQPDPETLPDPKIHLNDLISDLTDGIEPGADRFAEAIVVHTDLQILRDRCPQFDALATEFVNCVRQVLRIRQVDV